MRFKKKSKTKRFKSKPRTNKPMARRKRSYRRSASRGVKRVFSRRTGSGIVNTVKPMASGIGGGLITETAVSYVAPQFAGPASYLGAYLFGGVKGVIGKLGFDVLTGRGINGLSFGGQQAPELSI